MDWWIDESPPHGPSGFGEWKRWVTQVDPQDSRYADPGFKTPPFRADGNLYFEGAIIGKIVALEVVTSFFENSKIYQYTYEVYEDN